MMLIFRTALRLLAGDFEATVINSDTANGYPCDGPHDRSEPGIHIFDLS